MPAKIDSNDLVTALERPDFRIPKIPVQSCRMQKYDGITASMCVVMDIKACFYWDKHFARYTSVPTGGI